jgi:putative transposase
MHLTLKKEATKPPGKNFLQQQAKFDAFIHDYNRERPPYTGLPELNYPFHDMTITVTQCGRLCFGRRKMCPL